MTDLDEAMLDVTMLDVNSKSFVAGLVDALIGNEEKGHFSLKVKQSDLTTARYYISEVCKLLKLNTGTSYDKETKILTVTFNMKNYSQYLREQLSVLSDPLSVALVENDGRSDEAVRASISNITNKMGLMPVSVNIAGDKSYVILKEHKKMHAIKAASEAIKNEALGNMVVGTAKFIDKVGFLTVTQLREQLDAQYRCTHAFTVGPSKKMKNKIRVKRIA